MTFLSILVGKKLKEGTLCRDDHQGLSNSISKGWRKLGRLLGIREEDLDDIDVRGRDFCERAYQMLRLWKEKKRFECYVSCSVPGIVPRVFKSKRLS